MNRVPYFHTADRVQVLLNQLHLWQGTRWQHAGARPNAMRCGVSGDCLFWVHVFKAIGALASNLVIPNYRRQEALGDKMAMLRLRIEETGHGELIWDSTMGKSALVFHVGDVLVFKNGMSGAHCGLVVRSEPAHFVHLTGNGLIEEPFQQEHHVTALHCVYRLMEAAECLV
jgi:hypothetical protein